MEKTISKGTRILRKYSRYFWFLLLVSTLTGDTPRDKCIGGISQDVQAKAGEALAVDKTP
jgi:hypothetical protein